MAVWFMAHYLAYQTNLGDVKPFDAYDYLLISDATVQDSNAFKRLTDEA